MKKLAFLITVLTLLNNNVNAAGEDDPVYQEELRQLEAVHTKDLENLNILPQPLEILDIKERNETNEWKCAFIIENIICPAQKKAIESKKKINQLKFEKLKEEEPYIFNLNHDDLLDMD